MSKILKKHSHGNCHEHCHEEGSQPITKHSHGDCHDHCHGEEKQINKKGSIARSKAHQRSDDLLVFKIDGMCCASEVKGLKDVLTPLIEGRDLLLSFDLINAKLILESKSKNFPNEDEITKAVAKTGMKATPWTDHITQTNKTFWEKYGHMLMNIASAIGLVTGFIIQTVQTGAWTAFGEIGEEESERPEYPPIATMVFYSICVITGSWFIFPKALLAIKHLKPNTKLLTILATAGAIGINQWFEAAVSMYLFSAAELIEAWNMERARKSIRKLMEIAPTTAHVMNENGTVTDQPVDQIPIGAIISIKPGERIPMDSVLISEFASINQAPITGESIPIQKETGDSLFAGTINGDTAIQCKVSKAASDSTLASIIRKVEEAQSERAKSDQWIEKFSFYYVPLMVISSIIVAIVPPLVKGGEWYIWIYKGLELLVISCPCSLIISTPVSIVAGITAAARSGVLIKGGIHLENAAYLKAFAMDKTGTITTGEPVVHSIIPFHEYTGEDLLTLAITLEVHSDHPLARAIQRKAKADGIVYQPADQFQVFKGKGAEGYIKDKLYWIGSHRFLHERVAANEPTAVHDKIKELETAGNSIVAIGYDVQICGLISIADAVRPESKNAIQAIKSTGIQRVVMLTGDNKGAAKVIADTVKIDEFHAELLPEDKVKQVGALVARYKRVAMVGDGINDAPAMAASNLGIAMGSAGSDTAIETADIALMSDDLGKLAWLVKHSRRTLGIIKQNVIFSLLLKCVFVGLTFADKSSLWLAIVADMGATFIVVSNSLRLIAFSNKKKTRKDTPADYPKNEEPKSPDSEVVIFIPGKTSISSAPRNCQSSCCKSETEKILCLKYNLESL